MKTVLLIFLLLFLIVLILLIPLRAEAKFVLDLESKSVYYVLRGAGVILTKGKVYLLDDFTPSIINDSIFFMKMKQSNIERYYMLTNLFKKIKIKEVVILTDGGLQNDAFLTSMIVGSFNALFGTIAPLSKQKKIVYTIQVDPIYSDTNLNVAGKTSISMNSLNLIIAIINSKIQAKRYEKEKQYV